jgi:serine protease DegQ
MYRLWLIFSQAATVCVALLFVVSTFRPEWLPEPLRRPVVVLQAAPRPAAASSHVDSYYEAVRRATPSVVNVFTSKEVHAPLHPFFDDPLFQRFFGDQVPKDPQRAVSLGSGVIVSSSGFILTNEHVVEAADEIQVALPDGKTLLAKIVGTDPDTDLAVLHVDATGLTAITFGSSDGLHVGDVVLAIGNPFGVGQTVTSGIVSALGRSGLHINTFENFIQTDAAINPGNSGGALIDAHGNLVGINTAIYSRTGGSMGIGFAIPAATAQMVMEQIIRTGSVTRGWIGVEAQEITPELARALKTAGTRGALIAGVLKRGPADRAGVRPGDVLLAVNAKPVVNPEGMLNLVAALAPGSKARLKLRRGGSDLEVAVVVGRRPKLQERDR